MDHRGAVPTVAQPRLGYIRKGLNGIKVSADVS